MHLYRLLSFIIMILKNVKYMKYLLKILNAICIVDTLLKTLKPSGYLHEATGTNCEVCKEKAICKMYWKILLLVLFKY